MGLAQLPLHWSWLVDPTGSLIANPFLGGHVWAADVVGDALWHGHWPGRTLEAGFPLMREARFTTWAVLLVAGLLRPLLSPLVTVPLATLLGPALGAWTFVGLMRRLSPSASSTGLLVGGVLFGLAPVTLGAALSGQVENSQTWVLSGLLWATAWAWAGGAGRALWLAPIWAFGAGTGPYLGMLAAFALPWLWWALPAEQRRAGAVISGGIAAGLGLLLVRRWLALPDFDPDLHLFRPAYEGVGFPPLDRDPPPAAPLDALLLGRTHAQVKALVVHQPYLGLVLLGVGLLFGKERRRYGALAVVGVLLSIGPEPRWGADRLSLLGHEIPGPAVIARWLSLPIAHGGQYYRAVLLAHLGLAGMVAGARPSFAGLGLLGVADALRAVALVGIPWPVMALPTGAWERWAADPEPGAILHLPMKSPGLVPNQPVRLAGHAVHHRPVSDTPRGQVEAPGDPLVAQAWSCLNRGAGCAPPGLAELGGAGFRYAVVDLPEGPERMNLMSRLRRAWGQEEGEVEGLSWWICVP